MRRATRQPPSWSAIMLKAFGIASMRVPQLRWSYLGFPWGRLHEMPHSVGSVVIDREYQGEHAVFCAPLLHPEQLSLGDIHRKVESWKNEPVEQHGPLRRLIRTTKLPLPLRRFAWWFGLNGSGYLRGRHFGTFAINSLAGMRGKIMQMCFPVTTLIYYGVPDRDGSMPLQSGFDHRVYDGYTAARAIGELENVLNTDILEEIRTLQDSRQLVAA